jgi:hypothetical protein
MQPAALSGGVQNLTDGGCQANMRVRHKKFDAAQAAARQTSL